MDDVKLFDRALDSAEVHTYSTNAIHGINNDRNITIYPNPGHNELIVENAGNCIFTLYNILGQKVQEEMIVASPRLVNTSLLPNGIYVVQLTAADGSKISQRFVRE